MTFAESVRCCVRLALGGSLEDNGIADVDGAYGR